MEEMKKFFGLLKLSENDNVVNVGGGKLATRFEHPVYGGQCLLLDVKNEEFTLFDIASDDVKWQRVNLSGLKHFDFPDCGDSEAALFRLALAARNQGRCLSFFETKGGERC